MENLPNPNLIVSIAAEPKDGKTYFSFTFPPPIACISFDMRARLVKPKFPSKDIDIFEFPLPVVETLSEKTKGIWMPQWDKVHDAIHAVLGGKIPEAEVTVFNEKTKLYERVMLEGNKKHYNTVTLDPGGYLWETIRYARNEEEDRAIGSGGKARNYGEPNARMLAIFQKAKLNGINLVSLHHVKDEWIDDVATGKKILDGWQKTNHEVDIIISMRSEVSGAGKNQKTTFYTRIIKNGYDPNLNGVELPNATYEDLLAMILGG